MEGVWTEQDQRGKLTLVNLRLNLKYLLWLLVQMKKKQVQADQERKID